MTLKTFPLLCIGLLALSGCGKDDGASKPKPPVVVAAESAQLVDYTPHLNVLGTVVPLQSVAVRSRVDGQIAAILFSEGASVRAGQPLFRLDDRAARAAVAQAAAALASAEANARQSDADYKRAQSLVASGFISGASIDQKRAAAASGVAAIGGARAALQAAQTTLSYLSINAPVAGRSGEIAFKTGATVKANDTAALVTINQLSPINVRFAVPPAQIQSLRIRLAAGPIQVTALARDSRTAIATGRLVFLDNNVDALNGSVAAKAEFPNARNELWPGGLVDVDVPVGIAQRHVRLPEAAVQTGQDASFVWSVKPDQTAAMTPVQVIGRADGFVWVDGVAPGAKIVTDAIAKLKIGGKVHIKPGKADAAKPDVAKPDATKADAAKSAGTGA